MEARGPKNVTQLHDTCFQASLLRTEAKGGRRGIWAERLDEDGEVQLACANNSFTHERE